jgi:hypothetical protein
VIPAGDSPLVWAYANSDENVVGSGRKRDDERPGRRGHVMTVDGNTLAPGAMRHL